MRPKIPPQLVSFNKKVNIIEINKYCTKRDFELDAQKDPDLDPTFIQLRIPIRHPDIVVSGSATLPREMENFPGPKRSHEGKREQEL